MKNSRDLYEWVNSHTGEEVPNALNVPENFDANCCHHKDHHKKTAYIGRFYLDNVVHVGTVYENQGLAFVDVEGNRKVVSSYQVLTCASPVKRKVEDEKHNDECFDENEFYFQ